MLKRVVHSLGLVEQKEKDSRRKNRLRGSKAPPELNSPLKDFVVRIIHAGGHQELYTHAVPVSKLMRKYPGMCVTWPNVFKVPHQSVLWHEDVLVPGHKYILISFRDVDKLKRKLLEEERSKEANGVVLETKTRSPSGHKDKVKVSNGVVGHEALETMITSGNGKMKEPNGVAGQGISVLLSPKGKVNVEESSFSARDFYVPKEKSTITRPSSRKGLKGKKPFVAPLPKAKLYRSLGWQPSLPTVKELSMILYWVFLCITLVLL